MWVRGATDVFESVGAWGQGLCLWGGGGCEGLSIMGEHGVWHVMKGWLADLDILMNVTGFVRVSIDQIHRDWLGSHPKGPRVVDTGKEQVVAAVVKSNTYLIPTLRITSDILYSFTDRNTIFAR